MDPNATLFAILAHLNEFGGDYDECLESLESLAQWIQRGGCTPSADDWYDVLAGAYHYCADYHGGQNQSGIPRAESHWVILPPKPTRATRVRYHTANARVRGAGEPQSD